MSREFMAMRDRGSNLPVHCPLCNCQQLPAHLSADGKEHHAILDDDIVRRPVGEISEVGKRLMERHRKAMERLARS